MTWLDAMRDASISAVARELGLPTSPARGASGGSIYGCPACGFERRHPSRRDRRGAVGIRRDDRGWRCHECDSSGDALDLVAFQNHGNRFRNLDLTAKRSVAEWCSRFTGDLPSGTPFAPLPPLAALESPVEYPPIQEVAELWRRSGRLNKRAADYLASRKIDAHAVADRDLARMLPASELPRWAALGGRCWSDTGHRLIVPCFDERGIARSALARNVDGGLPKSVGPNGYGRRGLIMADPLAVQLLRTAACPDWFDDHELRIVVAEGEIDFLLIATAGGDADEYAHASFGVFAGSFTAEIAARIPDRSTVVIATDHDEPGERYAFSIEQLLRNTGKSMCIERWSPVDAA